MRGVIDMVQVRAAASPNPNDHPQREQPPLLWISIVNGSPASTSSGSANGRNPWFQLGVAVGGWLLMEIPGAISPTNQQPIP